MATLVKDLEIEIVSLVFKRKTDGATATYWFSTDYYPADAIFSGSRIVYPLLVAAPEARRGVGPVAAIRYDTQISIFGKTDFTKKGFSFCDFLDTYELHSGECKILYIPKAPDATTTYSATDHLRQTMTVVDVDYDHTSGVVVVSARDTWFKDSEFSRPIAYPFPFSDVEPEWRGEYGSWCFGDSTITTEGVTVDCPVVESAIASNVPRAKLFLSWTLANHGIKDLTRLMVKNQYTDLDNHEWLQVALAADPQVAQSGVAGFTDIGDEADRFLSRYSRGFVYSPATNAEILNSVRISTKPNATYWGARFTGAGELACPNDPNFSAGVGEDEALVIGGWFYLANKSGTYVLMSKEASSTQRDWRLWYDQSSDRFKFEGYGSSGSSVGVVTANGLGSPSAGTWYYISCYFAYGGFANSLSIRINNNVSYENSATTTGAMGKSGAGVRIGSLKGGNRLVGRASACYVYRGPALTSVEGAYLYNSGAGMIDAPTDATYTNALVAYWPLTETDGIRSDTAGRNDLSAVGTVYTGPGPITASVTAADGELTMSVFAAEYQPQSASFAPVGAALRQTNIDIGDSAIQAGTTNCYFQFDPLVMSADVSYFFLLEWTGRNEAKSFFCNYRTQSGITSYRRKTGEKEAGWEALANTQLDLEMFILGYGDDGLQKNTALVNGWQYAYLQVESKQVTLTTSEERKECITGLEFKAGLRGIEDDSGGTYTGSAFGIIKNPADIVRWLLEKFSGAASIDTAAFATARTVIDTYGLRHTIVVNTQTSVEALILEICRQGLLAIYKKRDGTITCRAMQALSATPTQLHEDYQHQDLTLVAYQDNDYSTVVNWTDQNYYVDRLDVRADPDSLRNATASKTNLIANPDYTGDRSTKATLSRSLYGDRYASTVGNFYDYSSGAIALANKFLDFFANLQRRITVRLPRGVFYGLELYSRVLIQHSGLKTQYGTRETDRIDDNGTPQTAYIEGVVVNPWSGGTVDAEVREIVEQGPFITIIAETLDGV